MGKHRGHCGHHRRPDCCGPPGMFEGHGMGMGMGMRGMPTPPMFGRGPFEEPGSSSGPCGGPGMHSGAEMHGRGGFGGHRGHGGHGCRPHVPHWGHGFHRQPHHWMFGKSSSSSSSSSDSSSDSETDCKKGMKGKDGKEGNDKKKEMKCQKKYQKKCQKHCKKMFRMRHCMTDPNWHITQCTLCWHKVKPLEETEVLKCGHLYHRMCLKELFAISQTGEEKDVFCCQCKDKIDEKLAEELKSRFGGDGVNGGNGHSGWESVGKQVVTEMEKLKV